MSKEYRTVSNWRRDQELASIMNEAADGGWSFCAVLRSSYWGSDNHLVTVVLMEREKAE